MLSINYYFIIDGQIWAYTKMCLNYYIAKSHLAAMHSHERVLVVWTAISHIIHKVLESEWRLLGRQVSTGFIRSSARHILRGACIWTTSVGQLTLRAVMDWTVC